MLLRCARFARKLRYKETGPLLFCNSIDAKKNVFAFFYNRYMANSIIQSRDPGGKEAALSSVDSLPVIARCQQRNFIFFCHCLL